MRGIIPRSFPIKLVLQSLLIIAAGVIITGAIFYFIIYEEFGPTYKESLELISALKQEFLYRTIIVYVAASFFLIGVVVVTLLYSHRIAGPIYRLGLTARIIAEGNLSIKVHLRKKDVVHILADSLNNVTENYSAIVQRLEKEVSELKENSMKIEGLAGRGTNEELCEAIGAISERAENIDKILSKVKV